MKKLIFLLASVLLLCPATSIGNVEPDNDKKNTNNTLRIACSPDLLLLAKQWSGDYSNQNPEVVCKIITATPAEMNEMLSTGGHIGLISKKYHKPSETPFAWRIDVCRDIIVPIFNARNPYVNNINQQGVSLVALAAMLNDKDAEGWKRFAENSTSTPLNYYQVSNPSDHPEVDQSFYSDLITIQGEEVVNGQALITAVQNDPYGMGFCRLSDLEKAGNTILGENILILPVDKNGNGQMDHFEMIYNDLTEFSRGVWIGKYPGEFVNRLYFVSNQKPENELERAFIRWALTDGQQAVQTAGFSGLISTERMANVEKLNEPVIYTEPDNDNYATHKLVLFIMMLILAGGLLATFMVRNKKQGAKLPVNEPSINPPFISENTITIPKGLYFDKTHTWVFMEKDGTVKVGVDDFLQHVTGPFTRVKMKKPNEKIAKNEELFSLVQNGKHLNIYSPVSGKIKEINPSLHKDASLVNASPYAEGWIYVIEPSNWLREIQFLKMADAYKAWLKKEFARLKDFLAIAINSKQIEYAQVTLQEGGEMKDHVLKYFGPEVWEDFQKNFINTSELS